MLIKQSSDCNVAFCRSGNINQGRKVIRFNPIIRIEKSDIIPFCMFQCLISRITNTSIRSMQYMKPIIFNSISVTYRSG